MDGSELEIDGGTLCVWRDVIEVAGKASDSLLAAGRKRALDFDGSGQVRCDLDALGAVGSLVPGREPEVEQIAEAQVVWDRFDSYVKIYDAALEGADVWDEDGAQDAALIAGGSSIGLSGVDSGAGGGQRVRLCGSAVAVEWLQERIDCTEVCGLGEGAGSITVEIVVGGGDGSGTVRAGVAGDDRPLRADHGVGRCVDAPTRRCGVLGDGDVGQIDRRSADGGDAAADIRRFVAREGAVGDSERGVAAAGDGRTATVAGRDVGAEGDAVQRRRAGDVEAATVAGERLVVACCGVGERGRTAVAETAAIAVLGGVEAEHGVHDRQGGAARVVNAATANGTRRSVAGDDRTGERGVVSVAQAAAVGTSRTALRWRVRSHGDQNRSGDGPVQSRRGILEAVQDR